MSAPDEARCWDAVTQSTCAVCLDRADDGSCHVPDRGADCPLRTFFTTVVEIAGRVKSATMDPYVAAIEDGVCVSCREMDSGRCGRRDRGQCALYAYLPLTVEAVLDALPQPA